MTGTETGNETLYIKEFGNYRALYHQGSSTIFGISTKSRRLQITDPDWQYSFDLEEGNGTKSTNPKKFIAEEYAKLSPAEMNNVRKNAEVLGVSMVKDFNGQTEQNASTILGYPCDRTTISGMTIHVIHQTDIPLLTDVNLGFMQGVTKAIKIDQGTPPEESFALPAAIVPVFDPQADELARQMAQKYIAALKEPDGAEKMRSQMQTDLQNASHDSPAETEEQQPSEDEQDTMRQEMQKGLDVLQGLFGK